MKLACGGQRHPPWSWEAFAKMKCLTLASNHKINWDAYNYICGSEWLFLNMNKTFNTHLPKYSAQARKQSWPWRKKTISITFSTATETVTWIFSASFEISLTTCSQSYLVTTFLCHNFSWLSFLRSAWRCIVRVRWPLTIHWMLRDNACVDDMLWLIEFVSTDMNNW